MKFSKLLAAASVLVTASIASNANALTLTDWQINTSGTGLAGAVTVHDFLDLTGNAYVHNTISGTSFTFNEAGFFSSFTADTGPINGGSVISPFLNANFTASGTGDFTTNSLTFSPGGILSVYTSATNVASSFAKFEVVEGSAVLNANSTLPNGTVSVIFRATQLNAGYFFDSNGTDLSTLVGPTADTQLVFGFSTTNVIPQNPVGQNVPASLVTLYNNTFNPDVVGPVVSNTSTDLFLSNNGQFRLSVPEPSNIALLGMALLGFGLSRKKLA